MVITHKPYQGILDMLKEDCGIELRFTTRIIFVSSLQSYIKLVRELTDMADLVIRMSDEQYCVGEDTIPDLREVRAAISAERERNIIVTSVGEYLRFAKKYEATEKCLRSIMTLPMHSTKRVWIPIYAAKDIFQDVVGDLSEERYELYEIEEDADEFDCFVYSDDFSDENQIAENHGLRSLYKAWDNLNICSGLSFSTKKISMVENSTGNYSVHVIESPFEYIRQHLAAPNSKFDRTLGSDDHWHKLAKYVGDAELSLEELLKKALNIAKFDSQQIVSGWKHLFEDSEFGMWILWLWYKLALAAPGDYLGFAIQRAKTYNDIQSEIECAIFDCILRPTFDAWVEERKKALLNIGISELCGSFWDALDSVKDERTKIKLLSNTTNKERTKIIEIISGALKRGKKISDYKSLLSEKYPELIQYLEEIKYCSGSLAEYMQIYKQFKIMDYYDLSISENAMAVDVFDFDSRGKILNSIKCSKDAYFLWIDGMGVEWMDMLIGKVSQKKSALSNPDVEIGMAVLPTTTSANMKIADPETVSFKFDELDSLSHIKDKSDCNYFSIIAKQFELMDKIADKIVEISNDNAGKAIVVTSDHGMSRMAAKAFHEKSGITPPMGAEVENLGRYCILSAEGNVLKPANAYVDGKCIAFKEHSHFTCSGYAPGEIHGGASPEEWLVPIIVFENMPSDGKSLKQISYKIENSDLQLDNSGIARLHVETSGDVKCLIVEVDGKTFEGVCKGKSQWEVGITGLDAGRNYEVRINPNNVFSNEVKIISVKRRGLEVDDDF